MTDLLVTITLSNRLFELLEDKLPNLGRRVRKQVDKEIKVANDSEIEVSIVPVKRDGGNSAEETETDKVSVTVAAQPTEVTKEPETPTAEQPKPTPELSRNLGVEVREIIHRTRQRFEGEDYKENADSEGVKKYHRALKDIFILIAVSLGYEKPSAIDSPEKVDAFAEECANLYIDDDGFIKSPKAPF